MTAVEAVAYARWGLPAVFEWQETQVLARRLRLRGLPPALGLHVLTGGIAGVAFVLGSRLLAVPTSAVLGAAFGFAMWAVTLGIHRPLTGSPARGVGVPASLVGHLVFGSLLGLWAA